MFNIGNKLTVKDFYIILWRDAAYSFKKAMPRRFPLPQLTTGFVYKDTKDYILLATNIGKDQNGKIRPLDGFLIPKAFIIGAEKIRVKNIWQKRKRK